MTAKKKTDREEAEAPVKSWELTNVQNQVDQHEKIIPRIEDKLDKMLEIIQIRPTSEQVDDKIKAATMTLRAETKNEVDKLKLTFGPIVINNKRLLWAVVGTTITTIGSLVLFVIGNLPK